MNKLKYLSLLWTLILCYTLNAQEDAKIVWLRYESVSGTPQKLRTKSPTLEKIRVGNQYTCVSGDILNRLKRRECATFRYNIQPGDSAQHYIVKVQTQKNTMGLSASYYFYGKILGQHTNLIREEYVNDFHNASFHLKDFSVGFYYARQLYAKNRHRLSLELTVAYRQTEQTLFAERYTTNFDTIDPDGEAYTRQITVTNFQEKQLLRSISVPLSLRYDWFMFKHLSIFISAGIQNDITYLNSTKTNYDFFCAGKYGDHLFQTTIDQNGFYDFGKYPNNQFEEIERGKFLYTLYGTVSIGLQLYLGKTLSIEVCGIYNKMLYRNFDKHDPKHFRLAESSESYQNFRDCLSPFAINRFGANCKLKISF